MNASSVTCGARNVLFIVGHSFHIPADPHKYIVSYEHTYYKLK